MRRVFWKYIFYIEVLSLLAIGLFAGRKQWLYPYETVVNETKEDEETYIKWVDFTVTYEALKQAYKWDVETYKDEVHIDWIELLACLACKYGGNFADYKEADMTAVAESLISKQESMETLTAKKEYYSYYLEAYTAVLGGLVGEYEIETVEGEEGSKKVWEKRYGLKGFSPIAKGFEYFDSDDFGVSRSYGYERRHLGHDMMGQTGTPVWKLNRTKKK